MNTTRRDLLRWTIGAFPFVALTGDELLAAPPERLPTVWPNGSLSQEEFERHYRLFSDLCHKAPTARQEETLAVAEEIYQLLHSWRPSAPPDDDFRRVSRVVLAHQRSLGRDFPVLRLSANGKLLDNPPAVELALNLPRPVLVAVGKKGKPSHTEIVELLARRESDRLEIRLADGSVVSIPVVVQEAATIRGKLFDADQKEPWPGRVSVEGSDGLFRHAEAFAQIPTVSEKPVVFRPAWRKLPFFYSDGRFEVRVPPGRTRLTLERGCEHELVTKQLHLKPGEIREVSITSKRFFDMRAAGWFSGDTHVHWSVNSWDENEDLGLLRVVQRAEDVRVVNNLTLHQWRAKKPFTKPDHGPPGPLAGLCDADHHVEMGEEFRNDNQYGHVNLLGLRELILPISTGPGSGGDARALDWPQNKTILEAARKQGAVVCEAHNLGPFGTSGVPVNVIHGLSDCLDQLEPEHYYRFLNCGIKIGLGNGSDHPARLVGCCRVYVHLNGSFTYAKWLDGLKHGRSFTTSGPLLFLTVNDASLGATVAAKPGDVLRIKAKALSKRPLGTFEVVSNGEVLKSVTTNDTEAAFDFELKTDGPRWLTARASRTGNYDALSGPDIAHTSAVYVDVAGKTVFRPEAAEWWIKNIRQHRERVRLLANFANDTQRRDALAHIDEGIRRYQELIDRAGGKTGSGRPDVFEQLDRIARAVDPKEDGWDKTTLLAVEQARLSKDARALETAIEKLVLLQVQINPEGRVRVQRGPMAAELVANQPRRFLIRIENASGGQQLLSPRSSHSGGEPNPFDLEMPKIDDLTPSLQGFPVEYRLLRITARKSGKRELNLGLEAGQGTQDIGFRGETPVLFAISAK